MSKDWLVAPGEQHQAPHCTLITGLWNRVDHIASEAVCTCHGGDAVKLGAPECPPHQAANKLTNGGTMRGGQADHICSRGVLPRSRGASVLFENAAMAATGGRVRCRELAACAAEAACHRLAHICNALVGPDTISLGVLAPGHTRQSSWQPPFCPRVAETVIQQVARARSHAHSPSTRDTSRRITQ